MAKKTTTRIFYSWQSDSPKKTNLNAIRTALDQACKRLEKADPKLKLIPDEATRGMSRSPNIALKILEKIEQSEIFVADITTVTSAGAARPCPNPNVNYELGYAVATLGWDRVILLFNKARGQFPADLPFDFIQNRASPYEYADADPPLKRAELSKFLETAIKAVLVRKPKRPAELKGMTREKIAHDSDVKNMRWLMESLHLPTLQQHISELPHTISERALWHYDNFEGVATNNLFSLYDTVLKDAVDKMYMGWTAALSYPGQYHETGGGRSHVFTNPGDLPLMGNRKTAWDEIDVARREMAIGLDVILDRLRADYMEIDIHETNDRAWKGYVEFRREMEEELCEKPKRRSKKSKRKKKKS